MKLMTDEAACKNCISCRVLKHNHVAGKGFEKSYCCVLFANETNSSIMEVEEYDLCEEFVKREVQE